MKINKGNLIKNGVIVILVLLLSVGGYYIYNLTLKNNALENEIVDVVTEKQSLLKKLQDLLVKYNDMVTTDENLNVSLSLEKEKVSDLITKLNNTQNDLTILKEIKKSYGLLIKSKKEITSAYNDLKSEKDDVYLKQKSHNDSLQLALRAKDSLILNEKRNQLQIKSTIKLSIDDLKVNALNEGDLGVLTVVDKASKASMLNISFSLSENAISQKGIKNYYVQIINPKNVVIGERKMKKFGNNELIYSFYENVNYQARKLEVIKNITVKQLDKGTFKVIVYDDGNTVATTTFDLK